MTTKKPAEEVDEEEDDGIDDGPEDDKPMSFWEHLEELRKRVVWSLAALVVGCLIAWNYKERILAGIYEPFANSWREQNVPGEPTLHFASPGDALLAYFSLSLIGGLVLAAPVVFFQLWSFIAPGLYAKEKRYVIPFVVTSTILFVGGGYFGYLAAFPFTFGYFLSLAGPVEEIVTITPTVMMDDYISFVTKMFVGFGIIFQVPILFTFLALAGAVTHRKLIRWFRYYVFIAFLVAAVLTPPDWASQVIMAVPAILLYGVSIGLVYVFQRKDALEAELEREREEEKEKEEKERKEREADERAAARRKAARARR
jgi:sec-independent protein translocase protein TatC